MIPSSRIIFAVMSVGCLALMGAALFFEHAMDIEPCPLCIMQRVMVIATGALALVAALHGPAAVGIRIYGGLCSATASVGGGVAIRQLWLQNLPPDQVPACGPSLDYLLDVFPLLEVLEMLFLGDGNCAEIAWSLFGISIPGFTLIAFIGLVLCSLVQITRPRMSS